MRRQIIRLRKSALARNMAAVAGGNSLAQVVTLGFAPLITRIYSPEVFGIQGVFLAAIALLAPIVALRFPMAIVLAKDSREVMEIQRLSIVTAAAISGTLAVALLAFRERVSVLLGVEQLGWLVMFLPLALLMTALQETTNYTAIREHRFSAISITTALQSLVLNGSRVAIGFILATGTTLVTISSLGPGLQAFMLSARRERGETAEKGSTPFRDMRCLVRRYRDFPLMRTPTDFLNSASQSAPVILLAVLFTPAIAGFYTLARSVLNMPVNVIGGAMGNVLYGHFAQMEKNGKPLAKLAVVSTLSLLAGPGLLIILLSLLAPWVFTFAFGENWRQAGVYAQWVGLWTGVAIANIPSVKLAPVIRRQGVLLVANAIILVVRLAAILIAYFFAGSDLVTVISYCLVSALANLGLIALMLQLTRVHDKRRSVSKDD